MVSKRKSWVFADSSAFILDAAHEADPRTPLTRKFLELVRSRSNAVTGIFNVLEFAGALSHRARPDAVAALARCFTRTYGVKIWPDSHLTLMLAFDEIMSRIAKRMGAGDAIVLWLAETCVPKIDRFVTWNVKHFEGRTHLEVITPQQYLRG